MQRIFATIRQVSATAAPVLICGETGTGKELVAREIHNSSPRRNGPFVAINAAALPESLIESELFGHEKGAFTGATERRAGCFEQAHGGTLFLDEIGEMPASSQPKLLRILEDLRVRRLGGKSDIPLNVRVLAATSHSAVTHLREEIYYRLSVFQIGLPPLRERKEDIPLVRMMIRELNKSTAPVLQVCTRILWTYFILMIGPAMKTAAQRDRAGHNRGRRKAIGLDHLSPGFDMRFGGNLARPSHLRGRLTLQPGQPLAHAAAAYIKLTLEYVNNDRKRAAEILGISLRTLQSRIGEFRRAAQAAAINA
jgi:transcriptional regulator with PAS, ATPase and Fis domain